jgi:alpha 1,2-mannosyltransferase
MFSKAAEMAVPAVLSMPPSLSGRHLALALLAIFGFLGLLLEYGHLGTTQTVFPKLSRPSTTWLSSSLGSSQFWIDFAPILAAAAPRCAPPQLNGEAPSFVRVSVPGSGAGLADRSNNILTLSAKDVDSMRKSHTWFVNQIKHEAPELEYKVGTQGIVTSAGGQYFPTLLVRFVFSGSIFFPWLARD